MAEKRPIPVAWDALEDAFENNAPEVHSFLHVETGDVTRLVDGVAEPGVRARLSRDPMQLRVNAVSSREQYRWMERFIETVEEDDLRDALTHAIDGKGAFRRFKDVLIIHPVERERWFAFRSERLRACMEAWLLAHDMTPVTRPEWSVPTVESVVPPHPEDEQAASSERDRRLERLHALVDALTTADYDTVEAFLEFLRGRARKRWLTRVASNELVEDSVSRVDGSTE